MPPPRLSPRAICAALLALSVGAARAEDLGAPEWPALVDNGWLSASADGDGSIALIVQDGSGNFATVLQSGAGNDARVLQQGSGNIIEITQDGAQLGVRVLQQGNNQVARVIQQD